jgi:hypothetical protein
MPIRRLPGPGQLALLRWAHLPLFLALCSSLLPACKSKPAAGRPCHAVGLVACADAGSAFVCEGAVPEAEAGAAHTAAAWTEVACRGTGGCARHGGADDCDDTVATEGDPCPRGPPVDYACGADAALALACDGGHFALWRACRGPEACRVVDGKDIHCDTSLGQEGDPCGRSGTYACSADRKTMLVCNGRALAAASACSGPAGCQVQRDSHKVDCDDSVAVEGDPCDEARRITCSTDHKSELVCKDGHYAKKRECRRTDCRLENTDRAERSELFCD